MRTLFYEKLARINLSIGEKQRLYLNSGIFFVIFFSSTLPLKCFVDNNIDIILSFSLCIVLLLFNYDKEFIKKHKGNFNLLNFFIVLFGAMAIIVGLIFGTLGYISIGAFYLFSTFISNYVVTNKKRAECIMVSLSLGMVISFGLLVIISIMLCPLSSIQYQSFTGNPNALGLYAVLGLCSALYLLFKASGKKQIVCMVLIGIACSYVIFSRSRTALLVMLFYLMMIFIWSIVNGRLKKKNIKNALNFTIIIIVVVICSYLSHTYVNDFIGIKDNDRIKAGFESIFCAELDYDYQNTTLLEVIKQGSQRSLKGIADESSFSSGRTAIWIDFIEHLNLSGHGSGTRTIDNVSGYNAHNGYLQVAYSYGVLAGGLYILISIYIALKTFRLFFHCIKRREMTGNSLFVILIVGTFFIQSMLSSVVDPFSYPIVLMLNFIVVPYISKNIAMGE